MKFFKSPADEPYLFLVKALVSESVQFAGLTQKGTVDTLQFMDTKRMPTGKNSSEELKSNESA